MPAIDRSPQDRARPSDADPALGAMRTVGTRDGAETPRTTDRGWLALALSATVAIAMAGCASYTPRPLAESPDLLDQVPLTIETSRLALPPLPPHRFNPADGLDMTEVAMLAAVNNPELKAQRSRAGVAEAQLFAAHLLPDPQMSLSTDHPTDSKPGLKDAYGAGLSYDLTALVTRGAGIDAREAASAQVDLETLWQEWQVIQKARLLYVQAVSQANELALLGDLKSLYADRYAHAAAGLRAGNVALDVAGTDLTALLAANSRFDQMQRQLVRTRHDLNAVLGLKPDTRLKLAPMNQPHLLPQRDYAAALSRLPRGRPDLLALQAGYQSQEALVRRAIRAQFPSLSVGINRAGDTSGVHTIGFGITLDLPIFDGNRGAIAVQRATREQLRREYQARLDKAYGEAAALRRQAQLIEQQLHQLQSELPDLQRMVHAAQRAYEARNIGALTYVNMQNSFVNHEVEAADLEKSLWDSSIALDTLLGWPRGEN